MWATNEEGLCSITVSWRTPPFIQVFMSSRQVVWDERTAEGFVLMDMCTSSETPCLLMTRPAGSVEMMKRRGRGLTPAEYHR